MTNVHKIECNLLRIVRDCEPFLFSPQGSLQLRVNSVQLSGQRRLIFSTFERTGFLCTGQYIDGEKLPDRNVNFNNLAAKLSNN